MSLFPRRDPKSSKPSRRKKLRRASFVPGGGVRLSLPKMVTGLVVLSALLIGLSVGWSRPVSAPGDPEFRPALIGSGPQSLVNLIDTARLIQAGEQDAIVMFDEMIFPFKVRGKYASVYPGSAGSELLQKAVLKALNEAEFISAIANHKPVGIDFHGTVMFFPRQKPNLRVFANQDRHELARIADFVAPQLIGGSTKWDSEDPQLEAARRMNKTGVVVLSLQVNEKGELTSSRVVAEDPPGFNFGAAILKSFRTARFVPGYRQGKVTACTFETTEWVSPYGRNRGMVGYR